MPRQKNRDLEALLREYSDDDNEGAEKVARVMSELENGGDDIKLSVYRLPRDGAAKGAFLTTMHPDDFSLEFLQREYGSGYFRIQLRGPTGQLLANQSISIESTRREDNAPGANDLARVLDVFQKTQEENNRRYEALLEKLADRAAVAPPAPPALNMVELMTLMNQQQQNMVSLFQVLNKDKGGGGDSIEVLLKGLELGKELGAQGGGGSAEPDSIFGLAKAIGPGLLSLASAAVANAPAAQAPVMAPNPAPRTVPTPPPQALPQPTPQPVQPEDQTDMNMVMKAQLKAALGFLCAQAQAEADPQLYAEMVIDNLLRFDPQVIESLLWSDNALDTLAQIHNGVNQFRPWFERLRQEALLMRDAEAAQAAGLYDTDQTLDGAP